METPSKKEIYQSSEVCMLNIGLNYEGTGYDLNGCISDAIALNHAFRLILAIEENNAILLRDDNYGNGTGSKQNIMNALKSIANKTSQMKDPLTIISYSGHGLQSTAKSLNNKYESDGKDEMIIGNNNGSLEFITDDELSESLDNINGRVIFFVDACNSGTIADLPYKYVISKSVSNNNPVKLEEIKENDKVMKNKNIIVVAAAQEDDEAYDVISNEQYRFGGEFTLEIINQLVKNAKSAYINLIDIAIAIKEKHIKAELPNSVVLSSSIPIDKLNTTISKMQIVKYENITPQTKTNNDSNNESNTKNKSVQTNQTECVDSVKQLINLTPKNLQKLALFKKLKKDK